MKNIDRTILIAIPLVGLLAAFWFLAVSPKQDQVKKLDAKVTSAQAAVVQARQTVATGVGARKAFPRAYHRLVVTGKAVPSKDETASLLVQINRASLASGIDFKSITTGGDASSTGSTTPTTTTAAPAAGGITPISYSLTFEGTFFQIADFIARLDRSVNPKGQRIDSDSRLITISGFSLGSDETLPGALAANVTVSAYSADPTLAAASGTSSTATPASTTTTPPPAPSDTSTTTSTPATP